jgi:hypothetical protein
LETLDILIAVSSAHQQQQVDHNGEHNQPLFKTGGLQFFKEQQQDHDRE